MIMVSGRTGCPVLPWSSSGSSTYLLGRVGDLITISGEKPVEWGCEELWTRELPGLHKNQAGDSCHAHDVTAITNPPAGREYLYCIVFTGSLPRDFI
jgi:hypothetical protein